MRVKESKTARNGGAQAERDDVACPYAGNERQNAAEGVEREHVEQEVQEVLV